MSSIGRARPIGAAGGGAKPDWRSFSRPAGEIRSVDQGVANDTLVPNHSKFGTPTPKEAE